MYHLYQLQILKKFACLGADCPQTCCSGWRISLCDQDIQYYKKNERSFGHFIKIEPKKMHAQLIQLFQSQRKDYANYKNNTHRVAINVRYI